MPLATVCAVVPVIVAGAPYEPQLSPVSVADLIVSVEEARPECVASWVSA